MSSTTTTEKQPSGRTIPFQIIGTGMCRTGTQSLADALHILGIGPIYHMRETMRAGHKDTWARALEAKYDGKGKPFGKDEFDELLGDFAGTTDIPTAFFIPELLAAYPDAHVIHTTRTEDSWLTSMRKTLWSGQQANLAKIAAGEAHNVLMATYWRCYWENDFDRTGPANWRENEAMVKRLKVQIEEEAKSGGKRKFLEFKLGDGWDELCGMLSVPVPRDEKGEVVEWPNRDDHRGWHQMRKEAAEKAEKESKEAEEKKDE